MPKTWVEDPHGLWKLDHLWNIKECIQLSEEDQHLWIAGHLFSYLIMILHAKGYFYTAAYVGIICVTHRCDSFYQNFIDMHYISFSWQSGFRVLFSRPTSYSNILLPLKHFCLFFRVFTWSTLQHCITYITLTKGWYFSITQPQRIVYLIKITPHNSTWIMVQYVQV